MKCWIYYDGQNKNDNVIFDSGTQVLCKNKFCDNKLDKNKFIEQERLLM